MPFRFCLFHPLAKELIKVFLKFLKDPTDLMLNGKSFQNFTKLQEGKRCSEVVNGARERKLCDLLTPDSFGNISTIGRGALQ